MRHCTPDELMDVVDDVRDEASLPHLAACALCREQLREVRQMLLQVADAPVPEPSPLFWGHLSARVHDAVAAEAGQPARRWWPSWRLALPIAGVLAALALAVSVTPRPPQGPPAVAAGPPAAPPGAFGIAPDALDAADASIALMLELAASLDLEAAASAGMTMTRGATDAAVAELTGEERRELERLLNEAMGSSGA